MKKLTLIFLILSKLSFSQNIYFDEKTKLVKITFSEKKVDNEKILGELRRLRTNEYVKFEVEFKDFGTIPKEFFLQKKIEELHLIMLDSTGFKSEDSNILSSNINSVKDLKVLEFVNFKFSSFPNNIYLPLIQKIIFYECSMETLPVSIYKLKTLRSIYVSCSDLNSIPDGIGKLKDLNEFSVHKAKITCLPNDISKLNKLNALNLVECLFLDTLPSHIAELNNLERLSLMGTPIKNDLSFICDLPKLSFFALFWINEKSKLPACFQNDQWVNNEISWEWKKSR